jgi:phosphatidylglycerophosphate synthase
MLAPTPTSWQQVRTQVPNLLSFARALAPLYLPALFTETIVIAPVVAAIVCFTDWLDGFLSRRWKCQSWVGAVLDIASDKIVCYTLGGIGIVAWGWTWWWIVPFAPVIFYDAFTLTKRAGSGVIPPSNVAKVKTGVLMVALVVSTAPIAWPFASMDILWFAGLPGMWIAALLIVWSALHYLIPNRVPDMPLPRFAERILKI